MTGRARRIRIMSEEGVPDGLVFFEGEVPVYENGRSELGIPEMKVHAEDRLEWASLLRGLRTICVRVDPDGGLVALDDLSVAIGHGDWSCSTAKEETLAAERSAGKDPRPGSEGST